ncbi:hypothetical protein RM844_00650 [Streptomyces sp. DSM 44915]|uniref:Membrane protein involved in the export of O-antigen and teichoic acid n=1 Tax=Streptomyces chisholmiae TaxID=3075540 RepID=A0ABU2JIH6_9ACTN|nr:hypothetical protein [Streptomyces sp. DSM 44915]MDT0264791.1 hypothetical protein [Streptomyces sp. DSM 44915]
MSRDNGATSGQAAAPHPRASLTTLAAVADQGVAAATNIAVVIVAARQSTADDFASFAVVYTVAAVLLGATGAFVGQPLVLRKGQRFTLNRHCWDAVTFTLAGATAIGAVLALATFALSGGVAAGLTALGLVLPIVLTQDVLRYVCSLLGVPALALGGDLLRLAVVLPVLAAQPHGTDPGQLVLAWGLSALPALLLGAGLLAWHAREVRGIRPARLLGHRHLGRRFVVEFGVGNAGSQLAIIVLGLIANPLVVGALRGASTLFGPLNVLFNAATGFGPPLLNRHEGPHRQARTALGAGVVLAGVAALWGLTLTVLPDRLGRELLGDTWDSATEILTATGTQYTFMALGTCALLLLRVLSPRATLPIQLVCSALTVLALFVGYALGGVLGAAWGLVLGSAVKAGAGWLRASLELRTVVRN